MNFYKKGPGGPDGQQGEHKPAIMVSRGPLQLQLFCDSAIWPTCSLSCFINAELLLNISVCENLFIALNEKIPDIPHPMW